MSKTYKIAFVPLDAFGHVNACIGLAQVVQQNGHQCVFIVGHVWKGKLSCYGFDEELYVEEHKLGTDPSQQWNDFFRDNANTLKLNSFDKIREFEARGWEPMINDVMRNNVIIKEIIERVKPDAIVVDTFVTIPATVSAGIPWIDLISCNQLFYCNDQRLPPGGSGYPTNGDRELWKRFREETIDAYNSVWNKFNEWVQSVGAPTLKTRAKFNNDCEYLTLYLCPEELDYTDIRPKPENWHNIDCLMRREYETQNELFELPEQLVGKPGKLIYLSMGTMCSSDLNLMKRLVGILSKSKNRFIVSKGPLGDEYDLPDNMWGQNSVKQIQILRVVDLVITHGGNNTVTESLYFGKPLIVMPVFSDQYDTSQRLIEKMLGIRLDPFNCAEDELLGAIDSLLTDDDLLQRIGKISERIKNSKSKSIAADLIIQTVEKNK